MYIPTSFARQFIAIEGCMGAGKTTLAQRLGQLLDGAVLLEETAKHPFVTEFYLEPSAYAIETEIAFVLLHYHQLRREQHRGTQSSRAIADFVLDRDLVFARLTLKSAEDQKLFQAVYGSLASRVPSPTFLIYLEAPLPFLLQRIRQRGRNYEGQIDVTYVEAVKKALDSYFIDEYEGNKLIIHAPDLDAQVNPKYPEDVASRVISALDGTT